MTNKRRVWIHPKARLFFLWFIIVAVFLMIVYLWKDVFRKDCLVIETENYDVMRQPSRFFIFDKRAETFLAMKRRELEERRSLGHQSYFAEDLFVGASITQGLLHYKYLEENQVYALIGMGLEGAIAHVDEIIARMPKTIYIMLGINDMDNGKSPEVFGKEYGDFIDDLKKALPKCTIVIQSVTPVQDRVYQGHKHITEERIKQYNDTLQSLAGEKDVFYMDLDQLFANPKVYEGDGLHVVYSFYEDYLNYIRAWEEESIEL